ncbi:MAG: ABC transporter transmembrane domain-containing protein, partial [Patiriisocius sp.]
MASANAFDFKLFKRLLEFTRPYRLVFYFVAFTAVVLSGLAILRPYFLERAIDESILPRDSTGLIYFIAIMIGVLVMEVLFQFSFIFYANWLGQHIIKDLRIGLFDLMMRFKMKYFDNSSVGRLTTRAVNDIETISSIFSQGLFMIIADLLKMAAIATFMVYQSWRLSLIVFIIMPLI